MTQEWVVIEPTRSKTAAGKARSGFRVLSQRPTYDQALAEAHRLDPDTSKGYRVWKRVPIPREPSESRRRR